MTRLEPLLAVVAAVAAGITIVALHQPRLGLYIVAAALGSGALLRLLPRPRFVASLVVRGRHLDALVLAGLAVAIAVLAAVTPLHAVP